MFKNILVTLMDFIVCLVAIDAGFGALGIVCGIYVAVRYLAPDCQTLFPALDGKFSKKKKETDK